MKAASALSLFLCVPQQCVAHGDSCSTKRAFDSVLLQTKPAVLKQKFAVLKQNFAQEAYGAEGCQPGLEITSLGDCEEAVLALGLHSPATEHSASNIPRFCVTREAGVHRSYGASSHFNPSATGKGRSDLAPVCWTSEAAKSERAAEREDERVAKIEALGNHQYFMLQPTQCGFNNGNKQQVSEFKFKDDQGKEIKPTWRRSDGGVWYSPGGRGCSKCENEAGADKAFDGNEDTKWCTLQCKCPVVFEFSPCDPNEKSQKHGFDLCVPKGGAYPDGVKLGSMSMVTGNDAPERDIVRFELYASNSPPDYRNPSVDMAVWTKIMETTSELSEMKGLGRKSQSAWIPVEMPDEKGSACEANADCSSGLCSDEGACEDKRGKGGDCTRDDYCEDVDGASAFCTDKQCMPAVVLQIGRSQWRKKKCVSLQDAGYTGTSQLSCRADAANKPNRVNTGLPDWMVQSGDKFEVSIPESGRVCVERVGGNNFWIDVKIRCAKLDAQITKPQSCKAIAVSATQKSTYRWGSTDCVAAKCIDGKTWKEWDVRCQGLCHTLRTKDPWFQLDLGASKPVVGVKVHYRKAGTPSIGNFKIQVSDSLLQPGDDLPVAVDCFSGTTTADAKNVLSVTCAAGTQGRYVTLALPGANRAITMQEMEVMTSEC